MDSATNFSHDSTPPSTASGPRGSGSTRAGSASWPYSPRRVRDLLCGSGGSPALIDELGVAGQLTWVDTAGVLNPKMQCPTACLTLMKVGDRA
ncbi:hypothetical protein ACQI4L_04330 [Mycolicibacterium litorale]|uniref:hypothetical protein n=1 Tax=Mycolicibacterium litorale TaxID=758802 RepID=UPI003CF8F2C3